MRRIDASQAVPEGDAPLAGPSARQPASARTEGPADETPAAAELREMGLAAAVVVPPWAPLDDPQFVARGFFTSLDHPVVGRHAYPGFPMRMSRGPQRW